MPSINTYGNGDMEAVANQRLKLATFNCDPDLQPTCLVMDLHIVTLSRQFDQNFMKILSGIKEIWS